MALAAAFGDPGGEGGISRFGTGGSVKSCIKARVAEKGEERPLGDGPSGDCAWLKGAGPDAGPRTGPLGGSLIAGLGCISGWIFVRLAGAGSEMIMQRQYGSASIWAKNAKVEVTCCCPERVAWVQPVAAFHAVEPEVSNIL